LANVLGKSDYKVSKKKNALQYMIKQVVNNEDISLYEGGIFYRDYIHVDDVVQAINLIIEKGNINEIYNIGNGEKVFIKQALDYVKDKVNSTSKFGTMEIPQFHKTVQTKNMILDTSKLKTLGYTPKYNLFQTLDTLI
jgi:nucleoside-diphosphate-sugar epimerase